MSDKERYQIAAHKMQTGVAAKIFYNPSEITPKHLRVGINAAMSDQAGLAKLLISKGVFTEGEYIKAIADQMEIEADNYELEIARYTGKDIKLG